MHQQQQSHRVAVQGQVAPDRRHVRPRRTDADLASRPIDIDRPGFLRIEEVLMVIPVSRASWYAMVKAGEAPRQVRIGAYFGERDRSFRPS
jgi:hypothetical protein